MRVSPFAPDFPELEFETFSDCPCPILDGLDGWRAKNARCRTISGRSLGVPALQAQRAEPWLNPDLAAVEDAWSKLPEMIRTGIMAVVKAAWLQAERNDPEHRDPN